MLSIFFRDPVIDREHENAHKHRDAGDDGHQPAALQDVAQPERRDGGEHICCSLRADEDAHELQEGFIFQRFAKLPHEIGQLEDFTFRIVRVFPGGEERNEDREGEKERKDAAHDQKACWCSGLHWPKNHRRHGDGDGRRNVRNQDTDAAIACARFIIIHHIRQKCIVRHLNDGKRSGEQQIHDDVIDKLNRYALDAKAIPQRGERYDHRNDADEQEDASPAEAGARPVRDHAQSGVNNGIPEFSNHDDNAGERRGNSLNRHEKVKKQ
ncbi:hypothetical protein SDC9_142741 [bioreactor metagenome]|uniref:Uncharacterized protein n=1 Tax=bioreactor metagenome TaxID=1076179 RepID=A0A645E1Z9_9ZZZZ